MELADFIAMTAVKRYGALQKMEELAWLIREIEPMDLRIIIEIGCDAGGTLYVWNRLAPTVLGIDLPGGPYSTGRSLTPHGSSLILGDSHDLRTMGAAQGFLLGEKADMLFLDGDHTYQGVAQDFEMYRSLISTNGVIVFQDIRDHQREDVGVHKLWEHIKDDNPGRWMEYMHGDDPWAGMGILLGPEFGTPPKVETALEVVT